MTVEASDVKVDHFYVNLVFDDMPHFSNLGYFGGFLCLSEVVDFLLPFLEYITGRYLVDYESWAPDVEFIIPPNLELDRLFCTWP